MWTLKSLSNLHGGKDKKDGEIDLNDHVHVVLGKSSGYKADQQEEGGRDEDSQEVVDDRTAHSHLSHDCLFFS